MTRNPRNRLRHSARKVQALLREPLERVIGAAQEGLEAYSHAERMAMKASFHAVIAEARQALRVLDNEYEDLTAKEGDDDEPTLAERLAELEARLSELEAAAERPRATVTPLRRDERTG